MLHHFIMKGGVKMEDLLINFIFTVLQVIMSNQTFMTYLFVKILNKVYKKKKVFQTKKIENNLYRKLTSKYI